MAITTPPLRGTPPREGNEEEELRESKSPPGEGNEEEVLRERTYLLQSSGRFSSSENIFVIYKKK
ncbi:MAG: hypothetical protein FDX02_02560 [Chlorobium sp.]|nr:MAG: hypothetical protein FDX02_02560 [Chlorobium sp.]